MTSPTPPPAAPHPDGSDSGRALAALRTVDPILADLIDRTGPLDLVAWRARWSRGRFESLARGIVGQQISTRAATAIYDRLIGLIGGRDPAQAIATASDDELRQVGLSRAKVAALRDVAARMLDGRLELQRLDELTDAEVRAQLITVRGIGPWTADLFLIGELGREDVLPSGDLGLRHAVQAVYPPGPCADPEGGRRHGRALAPVSDAGDRLPLRGHLAARPAGACRPGPDAESMPET